MAFGVWRAAIHANERHAVPTKHAADAIQHPSVVAEDHQLGGRASSYMSFLSICTIVYIAVARILAHPDSTTRFQLRTQRLSDPPARLRQLRKPCRFIGGLEVRRRAA